VQRVQVGLGVQLGQGLQGQAELWWGSEIAGKVSAGIPDHSLEGFR